MDQLLPLLGATSYFSSIFYAFSFFLHFHQVPQSIFFIHGGMVIIPLLGALFSNICWGILLIVICRRVKKVVGREKIMKIMEKKYGKRYIFIKCLPLLIVGIVNIILITGIRINILNIDWVVGTVAFVLWIASFFSTFSLLRWLMNNYFLILEKPLG